MFPPLMNLNGSIERLHNHGGDRGDSVSFRHTGSSPPFDYYISSIDKTTKEKTASSPQLSLSYPEFTHGGSRTHTQQIMNSSIANLELIHSIKQHRSYLKLIHGGSRAHPLRIPSSSTL
ncbi:hypothetical protein HID58_040998 [Brassica napus]|uniref:Uncharacterized protein n=1 Tax=Brassica napus TaxID=3708 RepID=A0ABQ8BB53_BRANA|nr:hypothetical protein HID58_040998 [Brassica napus]